MTLKTSRRAEDGRSPALPPAPPGSSRPPVGEPGTPSPDCESGPVPAGCPSLPDPVEPTGGPGTPGGGELVADSSPPAGLQAPSPALAVGTPDEGTADPRLRRGGTAAGSVVDADATLPARPIREPGLTIVPGPRPLLSEVSDEAASFALRREMWDLPVVARFTIEGEPVSKSRARFTKRGSKTQAYTPEKTHEAEQVVGWQFRRAAPRHKLDSEASYGVIALFFCGTRQRRDVDNMLKLILDGLNKVAWPDDEQVTEVSAKKTLTLPEHARTEVVVYQVGKIQRFTHKCEYEPCGREFPIFQSTSERRFCSTNCANAARRKYPLGQIACAGCGSLFTGSKGRRYCSPACFGTNGRTSVTCTGCGTEFTKQKCHVRAVNYCSGSCRDAANRDHRQKLACGTCETCGGPTSKKTYRQCNACRMAGTSVTGKPRAVAS